MVILYYKIYSSFKIYVTYFHNYLLNLKTIKDKIIAFYDGN
jgi:hypothetical protein